MEKSPYISLDDKNDDIDNIDSEEYIEKHHLVKKLNERIKQLEEELQTTKECLQTSNQEHLVYNEELQSTNEEIQSVNNELQKIIIQYKNKNQELSDLYDDMTNYINSADIGTIFLDSNLCIRKFTSNITKEINLKAQDIGRPINHITNNMIDDDIDRIANEVLRSHVSSEREIQSKDGNWYLLKCAPYCTYENLLKGVVISFVDITKIKNIENENEIGKRLLNETLLAESLKTEFFSNLSHELKTPLNVILCTLQLMDTFIYDRDHIAKEREFIKYSNIMKQNCYRQLRLVNNMIDITKFDSGFLRLNLVNCNIVNVVENITLSVSEYIKSKCIELIFDTEIEECILACDPEMIERVILNLLSNSVKFTNPSGSMSVNMYKKEEEIYISIKDTGIGIPNDKLDVIFDRFRQVDKSHTRKQEGSGIGLSIVRSLVELHGGKITVLSEYGKGTEFIIMLPIIVLLEQNGSCRVSKDDTQETIQRMHIEFSDIYSLK